MVHLLTLLSVQNGATALWIAAQNGHVRAVEVLIAAKAGVDINKVRFTHNMLFTLFTSYIYRQEIPHFVQPVSMVT